MAGLSDEDVGLGGKSALSDADVGLGGDQKAGSGWDFIKDVPSEIGKEAAAGASDVAALANRVDVGQNEPFFSPSAAAEGLMTAPRAAVGALRTVFSPAVGAVKSVLGHGMANAEHAFGENVVNPILEHYGYTPQHPDPEQMYETAKGDVDTAMSAVRPAGAPVKLPGAPSQPYRNPLGGKIVPAGKYEIPAGKPAYEWGPDKKVWQSAPPAPKLKPIGRAEQPETEAFFDAADQHYENMRGYGVEIDKGAISDLATNIRTELETAGYDDDIVPKTYRRLKKLDDIKGQNATISDIENVRKGLNIVRKTDFSERDAVRRAIGHIDDYLADLKNNPQDVVVNPHFAGRVSEDALAARANYAAASRSADIDEAIEHALLQAGGTYSGQNFNNALRQQLKALYKNKKKMLGWNDAEKAELKSVVFGSWTANRMREAGKFAPHGPVTTGMAIGLGHLAMPGAGEVLVPAGGWIARKIGDRLTKAATDRLSEVVKGRSPLGRQISINAAAQSALAPPPSYPGRFATGIAASVPRPLPAINIRPLTAEQYDEKPVVAGFARGGVVVDKVKATIRRVRRIGEGKK